MAPAAVSIGYSQDARRETVWNECCKRGIPIVRRITGGKAVLHFGEITYSVVSTVAEKIFPPHVAGTHKVISRCILRGLKELGIHACLAEEPRQQASDEMESFCFASAAPHELLVDRKKICGSAQIRKRNGFLQHGSLLVHFDAAEAAPLFFENPDAEKIAHLQNTTTALAEHLAAPPDGKEICEILKAGFEKELNIKLQEGSLTTEEEQLKKVLIKKYMDKRWVMDKIEPNPESICRRNTKQ